MKAPGDYDEEPTGFIMIQQVGNEIEKVIRALADLNEKMREDTSVEVIVSEVEKVGTTIREEIPHMFGAETILMDRAGNDEILGKIMDLISDFKQPFYERSPPRRRQEISSTMRSAWPAESWPTMRNQGFREITIFKTRVTL